MSAISMITTGQLQQNMNKLQSKLVLQRKKAC